MSVNSVLYDDYAPVLITARRPLLRGLQVVALFVCPLAFAVWTTMGVAALWVGVFLSAAVIATQLSFWGNYLPRVFPTRLRGTGASFAVHVGGRMIGPEADRLPA